MGPVPEPHPLDFDWRFTKETTDLICGLLPKSASTLAVGAPSVARCLDSMNRSVTLVDRQPIQGVRCHAAVEVGGQTMSDGCSFQAAIVDPPWYPWTLREWLSWAASCVEINGSLICSLWPDKVRLSGREEADEILSWMASWATVEMLGVTAHYERPVFESAALRVSPNGPLARSPGEGRLLRLWVKCHPRVQDRVQPKIRWLRFILNHYQLAVLLGDNDYRIPAVHQHPSASGWVWPYVSRRAPGRDRIGIWSSHNEVGIVNNPYTLVGAIRRAVSSSASSAFETELTKYPELLTWDIPRPPYWRVLEWHHP